MRYSSSVLFRRFALRVIVLTLIYLLSAPTVSANTALGTSIDLHAVSSPTNEAVVVFLDDQNCLTSQCVGLERDRIDQSLLIQLSNVQLAPGVVYRVGFQTQHQDSELTPTNVTSERVYLNYTQAGKQVRVPLGATTVSNQEWAQHEYFFEVPDTVSEFSIEVSDFRTKQLVNSLLGRVNFILDDFNIEETTRVPIAQQIREGIQARQSEFVVSVVDANGQPLANTNVQVSLQKHEFHFGTTYSTQRPASDPQFRQFVAEHFNAIILEDIGRMGVLMSSATEFGEGTLERLDSAISFASENDLYLYGHVLINGEPRPDWLQTLTREQIISAFNLYLDQVFSSGRSEAYDFYDVSIHLASRNNRQLYEIISDTELVSYVASRVQQRSPSTQLVISDAGVLDGNNYGEAHYRAVEELLASGVAIDMVALQGHFREEHTINPHLVLEQLDYFAQLGLPLIISEFDVVNQDVQTRAENVELFYKTAFSHPSVIGIYNWGFHPTYMWRGPDAAWIDENYQPNAAGQRYLQLQEEWRTEEVLTTNASGQASFSGFDGVYELAVLGEDGSIVHTQSSTLDSDLRQQVSLQLQDLECLEADITSDGFVDLQDYSRLSQAFFTSSDQDSAEDLNGDGVVNLTDYSILARNFFKSCQTD